MASKVETIQKDAEMLSAFGGFDKNILIPENCFSEMKNMTGDHYPMASSRASRGVTSLPEGVTAMQICNTHIKKASAQPGTGSEFNDGIVTEDVVAVAIKKDDGKEYLELYKDGAEVLQTSNEIGNGDPERGTTLISHAGFVYAFPQGYKRACYEGGESGPLSNVTVTRRIKGSSQNELNYTRLFRMQPCDSDGKEDSGSIASRSITKIYDRSDNSIARDKDNLLLVRESGLWVNEYGTTVKVDNTGTIIEKYYGVGETLVVPYEGFILTGNGTESTWLWNNTRIGQHVAIDESPMVVSIYESEENSIVYKKPDTPFNGLKWYDSATGTKYVYSSARGSWIAYTTNHIQYSFGFGGVGNEVPSENEMYEVLYNGEGAEDLDDTKLLAPFRGFKAGDAIEIKGFSEEQDGTYVIEKFISATKIVLNGVIDGIKEKLIEEIDDDDYSNALIIKRAVPKMDFVIECNNRLWGCYFGVDENGKVINEIYASALGDPTNWRRYQGISTDSWTTTVGADGPFTGAIQYGGYPLFFKENAIIRVYGTTPASFQIASYNYRGVQKGSHKSLAICDEVLYYLSGDGVMAYSGSVPQKVSQALGSEAYHGGVAGAIGSKYYLSCMDSADNAHLFVFDARYGFWHREDDLRVSQFLRHKNQLYMLTDGKVITATGGDSLVEFEAVTGEWGLSNPYRKHFNNFIIRAFIPFDSTLTVYISYDGGPWSTIGTYSGDGMRKIQARITDHSCDNIRLKFEGSGPVKIISVYREISQGGKNVY